MRTDSQSGSPLVRCFHSPEKPYRVGLLVAGAVVLWVGGFAADDPWALRLAASLVLVVTGWRVARVRLCVTPQAVTDMRMFTQRSYDRSDIDGVGVGRPGGLIEGYSVVVTLKGGRQVPLRGYTVYSLIPSREHLRRLDQLSAELRNLIDRRPDR